MQTYACQVGMSIRDLSQEMFTFYMRNIYYLHVINEVMGSEFVNIHLIYVHSASSQNIANGLSGWKLQGGWVGCGMG